MAVGHKNTRCNLIKTICRQWKTLSSGNKSLGTARGLLAACSQLPAWVSPEVLFNSISQYFTKFKNMIYPSYLLVWKEKSLQGACEEWIVFSTYLTEEAHNNCNYPGNFCIGRKLQWKQGKESVFCLRSGAGADCTTQLCDSRPIKSPLNFCWILWWNFIL